MSHLSVRRLLVAGLAVAVVSGFLAGTRTPLQAQQQPASVFLAAVDQSGAPIADFEPSQVKLTLDGVPCPSMKLEPVNWPMKLQVLIDNSGVMRDQLPSLRDGLRAFLKDVPDGVEVAMYVLSPQPRPLLRPTTDRQAILKAVDVLGPDAGGAKLLDGLSEAVSRIQRDKGNFFHTVMVFTSDGIESSNGDTEGNFDRLQKQIQEQRLTVHVLMLSVFGLSGQRTTGLQLNIGRAVTRISDGRFENVTAATALPRLFAEYAQQITRSNQLQSHQYRVTCDGSTAKAPRISVSTSHPRVANVFVTRNGQIAGN